MIREIPEWAKIKYRHEREVVAYNEPVSPKGGKTYAFLYNDKGELVAVGMATCHVKDNFNRRIGRDIARGRALKAFENNVLPGDE